MLVSTDLKLDNEPYYLSIHLDKHLAWEYYVKSAVSTCYGKLPALRKIKNFTSLSKRKVLTKSIILSKIDFSDYIIRR